MIHVLCDRLDGDAIWLAGALTSGGATAETVFIEDLVVGSDLRLRVDDGGVSASMALGDGRRIDDSSTSLIINRLVEPTFAESNASSDPEYLREEWRAALAAWLRAFRQPVFNPPRAATLCGPTHPRSVWAAAAAATGVPVAPDVGESSAHEVDALVVDGVLIDPSNSVPSAFTPSLGDLARWAGAPLLGVSFAASESGWGFIDATPTPSLASAGEGLVDALIAAVDRRRW